MLLASLQALLALPFLLKTLITDHFDPGLTGDADTPAFRIDATQQIQWEIDIDALFNDVAIGEVRRYIFPSLRTFGHRFDVFYR
jgi:hypothetical protein